jgi:hypothetical protein
VSVPSARSLASRAAYEVMTVTSRFPRLALPAARARGHGVVVTPTTDIVIEGYPRSGNSLAFASLLAAQPAPIVIAHHTHAPANVIAGVEAGIPVLVLIRAPEDAVVGLVLIKPDLTVVQAMRGYRRFYEPLLPYRDRIVVSRSEDVIDGSEGSVERINQRFGTSFEAPELTANSRSARDELIERYWRDRVGPGLPLLGRTERGPSEGLGDDVSSRAKAGYLSAPASLRRQLSALYRSFTEGLP